MWTSSGKFYSFLFIFGTLQFIPLARCSNPPNYVQWDLAVAHENRVMVVSNSGSSLDLSIQMPKTDNEPEAFAGPASNIFNPFKPRIEFLAADPDRGLIFFNHVSQTTCSVALFDLHQNSTHILIQKQKINCSIGGLAYHQNFLFWTDKANKNIMRLNTSSFPATLPPPEEIVSLKNENIVGLAIHPTNNLLFWAIWSPDFTASKIYSFDIGSGVMKVAVSEVTQPDSVVADENYLYWIDDVEGINFHIERVRLPHFTDREVLHRGQHQNPISLAILSSSKLVWTDIHGKSVHELDLVTKQTAIVKQFKKDRVFGLASFTNEQQNISNDAPFSPPNNSAGATTQDKVATGDKKSSQDVNVQQASKLANPSDEKIIMDTLSPNSSSNVQKKDVPVGLNSSKDKILSATVPTNSSNQEKQNDINNVVVKNSSEGKEKTAPLTPNSSSEVEATSLTKLPTHNNNISNNKKNNSSSIEFSEDRMEWCGDWESIPCLNGASCLSVNRKIFCLCVPGFSGPTCGDTYDANEKNKREVLSASAVVAVGSCLIGGIVIMTMVIVYLALRVRKLNKKPKIHKKIVVAKSRRGDRNSSSVCEMIDIENCCNMNVCETPCYDPIGPTTSKSSKSIRKKFGKDDDKERLIDS